MKRVINSSKDPYFNLALEEWLMENSSDDVFVLWQNSPSVILGLSQNAFAEVNIPYADDHGIKIARRITGGGAVYHDLNNINFSFKTHSSQTKADPMRDISSSIETSAISFIRPTRDLTLFMPLLLIFSHQHLKLMKAHRRQMNTEVFRDEESCRICGTARYPIS